MRNIKITIAYDGSDFCGWQMQAAGRRTIQAEIETALENIFKAKTKIFGSGRTDSGVHAVGQVANFKTDSTMQPSQIVKALNARLPQEIIVVKAQNVPESFHAQFSAKSKVYRYTVLNSKIRRPLVRNFSFHYPYPLDLKKIKQEMKSILGTHDFRSFRAADSAQESHSGKKSSIRTIKRLTVKRQGEYVIFDIEASGFLYKMVRNIIGTLLEIGSGLRPKGMMEMILDKKSRTAAGQTAQAQGLCLLKVNY